MMKQLLQLAWLGICCISLSTARAGLAEATKRPLFLTAEKIVKQGQTLPSTLQNALQDYPLYPYLEYARLQAGLKREKVTSQHIQRFLSAYADTPLASRLRRQWLTFLAKKERWKDFLHFYTPQESISLQCHYLHALIQQGQKQRALAQVLPLWQYGKSRPKACDPVFKAWRQAGHLSRDYVWQRIALAMQQSQLRLVNYLKRFLPKNERPWVGIWLQAHKKPESVLKETRLEQPHAYRNAILLHALYRTIRRDPVAAIEFWNRLQTRYRFDAQSRYQAQRKLVLWLVRRDNPKAWAFIRSIQPNPQDASLHEALVRAAIYRQQWPLVLAWIERMPATTQSHERWRYWRARALEALGKDEQARQIYRELASSRSYHGFLAADRIQADYQLQHRDTPVSDEQLQALKNTQTVQRIEELLALERELDARREWYFLTRDYSIQEYKIAAKLAQSWNWHDQAIFTLAKSGYWDDLKLRFPLAHRSLIHEQAKKQHLDVSWIYGIIRQESAFNARARSHAGALGLMQLMPATARFVSKKLLGRKRVPTHKQLLRPEINIELGAAYLAKMYEKFAQNPVLATAAYNAGPHRVERWLPRTTLPADIWIELIPFRETRRYVQRVLTYATIYDQRLERPLTRLSKRMPPIPSSG